MNSMGPTAPADLAGFAGQSEDMLTGAAPDEHTWLWVEAVSWEALGGQETWRAVWAQAQQEHSGHWNGLLDLAGHWEPLTVALVAGEPPGEQSWPNVWDGNHRLGAAAVLDLVPGPLVLGGPHDLRWEDVPAAWQQVPALQQHFQRPVTRPRLR